MFLKIGLLLGLLLVSSVSPGLFFLRRLRWSAGEKWCASIALSLALLYGTSFVNYLLDLPGWTYWVVSAGCALLTLLSAAELRHLLARRRIRRWCLGFAVLFGWGLLLLALARHYSGGTWSQDWYEHYDRARFFLDHRDRAATMFYGELAARPPFMNLVAAHFLAQTGVDYAYFQVVCLWLNLLVFFPLCLIAPAFAGRRRWSLAVLVVLLMLNPMLQENVTWTWTKALAAFYVVLGLALYLAGWRKGDYVRLMAAFLCLAAGMLVHFSAGPYALFVGLHYLVAVWPYRRHRWRELGLTTLLCTLLLATWFYWAREQFGTGRAFGSNTTMQEFQNPETSWPAKLGNMAHNVFVSVVPHPLQLPKAKFDQVFAQHGALGYLRDYVFLIYQVNCIFAMGSVGGALVLYLLGRAVLRRGSDARAGPRFWLLLVGFCGVVGVLVHPMRDPYGLAHICGQPLVYLGVTYLAANYRGLPPVARWLGVVGCTIDFALGIFLHFSLENRLFTFRQPADGPLVLISDPGLSHTAKDACAMKFLDRVTFLGDTVAPFASIIQGLVVAGFLLAIWQMLSFIRSLPRGTAQCEPMRPKASVTETADSFPSHLPNRAEAQSSAVSH
jgi:hypothetical protein